MDIPQIVIPDTIPPEIRLPLQMMIEGRVKQIALVIEDDEGCIHDMYSRIDGQGSAFAMVGALENLKRDYMRRHIESRIKYAEREDDE
jgi:DNA-binding FrmR family transcriptional regulator